MNAYRLRLAAGLLVCCLIAAAAWWLSPNADDLERIEASLAAHRHAWYALPAVMLVFVVLGLALVPVIFLVAATGIAFGPLLGPMYAMAGCLASASTGFAIGRMLGLKRVHRLCGERVTRVMRSLKRNGTLAVFLVRKVPAPFTLVNIIVGASTVRYLDFVLGTVLGMGALVIGLAGFGYQFVEVWRNPSPDSVARAAVFVLIPLTMALLINHAFRRLRPAE